MIQACIVWCVQIAFTVDRIEPPWAIVEWSPMGSISDVHISDFPSLPREGSHWILRVELRAGGVQPAFRISSPTSGHDSSSASALTPQQPARTTKTTTGAARVHSSTDWCIEPETPEGHPL